MKLTILGNQGPFPGPEGACSGYLIETEKSKILIDCGSGVLSNLQKVCKVEELDAVILSHLHYDHFSDILVFKYNILVSRVRKDAKSLKSIDLYCPNSPSNMFELIDEEAFNVNIINVNTKLNINNLSIDFCLTDHIVECYATKIQYNDKKFVYTGDSSYTKSLIDFSKDADLLISDGYFSKKHDTGSKLVHMTSTQNAQIAKEAGVKKLLLTHFWPYDDISVNLKEAKEVFENVENSEIMKSYEI